MGRVHLGPTLGVLGVGLGCSALRFALLRFASLACFAGWLAALAGR